MLVAYTMVVKHMLLIWEVVSVAFLVFLVLLVLFSCGLVAVGTCVVPYCV